MIRNLYVYKYHGSLQGKLKKTCAGNCHILIIQITQIEMYSKYSKYSYLSYIQNIQDTPNTQIFKGDGGVGTFDVGGGPAFIFGSNLPIFLGARLIRVRNSYKKIKLNFNDL